MSDESANANSSVTATRTVTTSDPDVIVLNPGYLKTAPGLLKIFQLVMKHIEIERIIINSRHFSL